MDPRPARSILIPVLILIFILAFPNSMIAIPQVSASGTIPGAMGPGTGTVLIHEYDSLDQEMLAFQAGALDIVDWPVPFPYLKTWTQTVPGSTSCDTSVPSVVCQGQVFTWKHNDIGMFEIDVNSNASLVSSTQGFRQALAYLVDRQNIVLNIAGGFAQPICAGTAFGQPGSVTCQQLGYPTPYGDYNPSKGLQVLYESGWRFDPLCSTIVNGITVSGCLASPPTQAPLGGTACVDSNNLCTAPIKFLIRIDDPLRTQAGQALVQQMQNLPNSYTPKTGGSPVTVCPSNPCILNVSPNVVDRRVANSIILTAPWNRWNLYTGGWGLDFDPDHLPFLYGSSQAPVGCGGAWQGNFPLNFDCFVDAQYDNLAAPINTGATYTDVINAAVATQTYAWGYSSGTGKITGKMPTVPLFSTSGDKAAWIRDYGSPPILTSGATGTGSESFTQRACWTNFVGNNLGTGLDNYYTLTGMFLNNCQPPGSSYANFKGQGVLDWGFKSTIQQPNIVTSVWLWDQLAMQQTYDSMLTRSPASPQEVVPVLVNSFGSGTYFNTALSQAAAVGVFKLRQGVLWNDGQPLTGQDIKFSIEYAQKNPGINYPFVQSVYNTTIISNADGSQTVLVFFNSLGALLAQNVGFLPIIPQHVWCADYNPAAGHNVGFGISPRANCSFPDATLFPSFQGLGCGITCPSGPIEYVGTGPYMIAGCSGADCTNTILLKPNPYYKDGTRFWSSATGVGLQPDVGRDGIVNQSDLDLLLQVNATTPSDTLRFNVDYRMSPEGNITFKNPYGTGCPTACPSVTVRINGPVINSLDVYIIQRLIFEAQQQGLCGNPCTSGGLPWPPTGSLTYVWPDPTRDNRVDVNDLVSVYLAQFKAVMPVSKLSANDVNYDGVVDIHDLTITYLAQFTIPPGMAD